LEHICEVSFFRDFAATSISARPLPLRALATLIRTTTAPKKDRLPWLKLARFGDRRSDKGSLRHDSNVVSISGIEADYDGETIPMGEAQDLLEKKGVLALIYTSPSHTNGAPRWRVLCPLSTELAPERRNHQLGRLNGLFRGIFSRESWVLSQSYYFGSVGQNSDHQVEVSDGTPLDTHDDLDHIWIGSPGTPKTVTGDAAHVGREAREDAELVRCIVTGEHFHVELCALAARYTGRNIPGDTVQNILRGIMLSRPGSKRDERWQDRYDSIPELVESACRKYLEASREKPDPRRKAIAQAAFNMLRQRRAADELVAELHQLNQQLQFSLPTDTVNAIALWCARKSVQPHNA
jgi:hypothetical protein